MKSQVKLCYCRSTNGEFGIHVQEKDNDYFIEYYNNWRTDEPQTEIRDVQYQTKSIKVQDLTVLNEEELFQTSLIWDAPLSIYFVAQVQIYIKYNISKWDLYGTIDIELEY